MSYDAFISYSHAADGHLAPAVQTGLERLTKSWWKRRALRVFRDETGLGVDPHMWRSIQQALDESSWFVLLASPEAVASRWVNKEIEHWLASKPAERILPVLTDGTMQWDDSRNDFAANSSAIPPALRSRYKNEPRYLDLRWARSEDELDIRHPRFKSALATLGAPLHDVTPADLEIKDVRKQRRVARIATAALALLTVAAVIFATTSVQITAKARTAQRNADLQKGIALISYARAQHAASLLQKQLRATEGLKLRVNKLNQELAVAQRQLAPPARGS